ncbi:MAG TPA: hypothetical protein VMF69_21300 [Gemmataceae bacterium]|nr:hypothetical protein [Gemmataceae bacterium]
MEQINARSIFSPATGFIQRGGFDWTCNPYVGCSMGCSYCYAMFLPQNRRPREDWGKWFQAKINAVELARKQAPKVAGQAVYLSSVTDPYLPAERSLCLTRGILEELLPYQPRLLIQTRGPLVVRDLDVIARFHSVRVNMSIPTEGRTKDGRTKGTHLICILKPDGWRGHHPESGQGLLAVPRGQRQAHRAPASYRQGRCWRTVFAGFPCG